jgi:hypothetical protein
MEDECNLLGILLHSSKYENKVLMSDSFSLRGKKREVAPYDWFKQIRREMPFGANLEKVICDGEDIPELVQEIDKAPLD